MTERLDIIDCHHDDVRHECAAEYDENNYRIRTIVFCPECGLFWHGCFAKRLDDDGQEAWGKPGTWYYSAGQPIASFPRPLT